MKKKSYKSKRVCEVYMVLKPKLPDYVVPAKPTWRFRVKRRENNEIIAQSEGYSRKIDCINTAKLVTGGRLKITIIK